MEYRNLEDVRNQLLAAGLVLESVTKANGGVDVGGIYVESVRSVRCDVSGEKKKKTGSYWLHELRLNDGIWITGAYWLDHGNSKGVIELRKTCAKCGSDMPLKATACPAAGCGSKRTKAREIPPEQIEAHKKRLAEARRQAEAEAERDAERAAAWANAVWVRCREIFSPDEHEYLARKKLKSAHGTRVFESNDGIVLEGAEKEDYEYLALFHGALVVPMCDAQGRRRALQFILSRTQHKALIAKQERDKNFWPRDMLNPGLHCVIGGGMRGVGLVAEGFATAASLAETCNLPVAVAFQANRMAAVAESLWKAAKKRLNLLIAADDDWLQRCVSCKKVTPVADDNCCHCNNPHGKQNAGLRASQDAARIVSGAWFKPEFSVARPTDKKGPTDFNDLRCIEGPDAVRAQVEAKLAELGAGWGFGFVKSAPRGAGSPSAGGGVIPDQGGGGERKAVATMTVDDAVERFRFVDDKTGEYVFDEVTREICKRTKMINMLAARVRGDDVKDHPAWRERAVFLNQIGFDPAGEEPHLICNLWDGWPTTSKRGKCDLLLELLQYQCSGEPQMAQELYQWVLRWLAYPIQHPGAKMQTAIIMHGKQGTGKGRFFEWGYLPIFARYAAYLDQDALEDKHGSDWQSCKLFVLADEVLARAEMYHHKNKLKNLVTSRKIRINPKGLIAYEETNHLNIVFLSNEKQPLVLENDDRRYCVIWTPPPVGKGFYDELSAELSDGGSEALHYYLKHEVDLGDFKPWTRPPMTEAKRDLINMGRDSVERFLLDWQHGDIDGLPFCPCSSADLYRAYLFWCRANGERMPRPENQFSGHVVKLEGWAKTHKDILFEDQYGMRKPKRQRVVIPSSAAMEDAVKRGGEDFRAKPGETATEWLTPCFFGFRSALRVEP